MLAEDGDRGAGVTTVIATLPSSFWLATPSRHSSITNSALAAMYRNDSMWQLDNGQRTLLPRRH